MITFFFVGHCNSETAICYRFISWHINFFTLSLWILIINQSHFHQFPNRITIYYLLCEAEKSLLNERAIQRHIVKKYLSIIIIEFCRLYAFQAIK